MSDLKTHHFPNKQILHFRSENCVKKAIDFFKDSGLCQTDNTGNKFDAVMTKQQ